MQTRFDCGELKLNKIPSQREDLGVLEGYHSPQLEVSVRLNTNESPFPLPDAFTQEFGSAIEKLDLNRYPKRSASELCVSIADKEILKESEVFVANGSNEVIQSICLAFGGYGRSALIFEPTYAMHSQIAKITGTRVLEGFRNSAFQVDENLALEVIRRERPEIVFLCSPNNPTGNTESLELIDAILFELNSTGGLLVVDEAYKEFSDASSELKVSGDSNLAFIRTFSKVSSLAGVRLGYLLAPEWCVNMVKTVSLPYHLDSVKQIAGILALKYEDEMKRNLELIKKERKKVFDGLLSLPMKVWPSEANFLLFKPESIEAYKLWQELLDEGILIRDCSSWDGLDGCLRVTIGSESENDTFLDVVRKIVK